MILIININKMSNSVDLDKITNDLIYTGLVLKNDYILLKKIGHGNNACVWMVYQISSNNFFAMKIQDHQCYNDGCREIIIIKKINEYYSKNPKENNYCIRMREGFVYVASENINNIETEFKFVCSVYNLYAGNIHKIINTGKYKYGLNIDVVKNITQQLLKAVYVLHEKINVIHTDIKPENILFEGVLENHKTIIDLFDVDKFTKAYTKISKQFSNNEEQFDRELEILAQKFVNKIVELDSIDECTEDFESINSVSTELSDYDNDDNCDNNDDNGDNDDDENDCEKLNDRNQSVDDDIVSLNYKYVHDLDNESNYDFESVLNRRHLTQDKAQVVDDVYVNNCKIVLTDFGNSYFFAKRTTNEIQDRLYRAPEIILNTNYGYQCDIWSIGCIVFELLTGFALFEPESAPLNRDIHHLYLIEKMLGPIPIEMIKKSRRKNYLFDNSNHIKNIEKIVPCGLRYRLEHHFLFTARESDEIYEFLKCLLEINPNKRWSVSQLLQHKWLN